MKLQIINRINRKQSTSQLPSQPPYKQEISIKQQISIGNNKQSKIILKENEMKENIYLGDERQKIQHFFNNFSKNCVVHYQQTKYQMTARNRKLEPLLKSLHNHELRQSDIKNSQFGYREKDSIKRTIKICSFTANSNQLSNIQEENHYYHHVKGIKVRKVNSLMDIHQLSLQQQNHRQRKPGFIMRRNMSMVKNQRESSLGINIYNQTGQQQIVQIKKQERQGRQLIKLNSGSKGRIIYMRKQLNIINQMRRIPGEYKLKLS